MAHLTVNGQSHDIDVDPSTPLLWVLREQVGLTGTKYGCGIGQCRACTVHVDGMAMRSCSMPVSTVEGKQITTIEGLAQGGTLHKVQQAWIEHDVPQCGYCQSGMIMAGAAVLKEKTRPSGTDIATNITPISRSGRQCMPWPMRHVAAVNFMPRRNRRGFVVGGVAAGGGLALGFDLPFGGPDVDRAADGSPEVNAWMVIRPDDTVVIRIAR